MLDRFEGDMELRWISVAEGFYNTHTIFFLASQSSAKCWSSQVVNWHTAASRDL